MGNIVGWVCSNGIVKDDFVSVKKAKIPEDEKGDFEEINLDAMSLNSPPSNKTGSNKVAPINSLGGARKAVDFLKTIGNSVSNFHMNSGLSTGMPSNGREISILAFEVANTISKAANLSQSLSEENIKLLKKELSQSEGIKQLVSTNLEELLSIAAADKRQEFDVILREVIRFGKQCMDPQWHNLDQYFSRLDLNDSSQKQTRESRAALQELTVLAQRTSELYQVLLDLQRFEKDFGKKVDELELLSQARPGQSLSVLQRQLNEQRKLARSFQSKCLWSRNLEEIVEKLVVVLTWINQAISKAFGDYTDETMHIVNSSNGQKLGAVGLALHYSSIIIQINLIASRTMSVPSNMRDALYRALPTSVKTALRSQLQAVDDSEEQTYLRVKAEMDKILQWLVPIAENTKRAHQASGRIGEWASQSSSSREQSKGRAKNIPIRLQTLYHADKEKTEQHILELVTLLNHSIHLARQQQHGNGR